MQKALEGVRVIEIAQEIQGPYAGLFLADFGADVIKIENRESGDLARRSTVSTLAGPDAPHAEFHHYFFMLNRGKRSLTLDLKSEAGKAVLMRLLATADVVLTNFRPGVLDRLGFGYESLASKFPRLIYATASSWGPRGPWANRPSRDMLAQAASGLMAKTGLNDSPPLPAGMLVSDYSGAMSAFSGIATALYVREKTGRGQRVDVSMYGIMLALQAWEILTTSLTQKENRKAARGHQFLHGVWGAFRTSDGWIAIAGVEDDRWPRFCQIIGREDLTNDPLFNREQRNFRGDNIEKILDEVMPTRTSAEWLKDLEGADVFVAPVAGYLDVLASEQALANNYIRWVEHRHEGRFRMVGCPIQLSETPAGHEVVEPGHGEQNHEILREIGFSDGEISDLIREGVV